MKVYRKIVLNMATGKIIHEDSYEYSGEVARCIAPAVVAALIMAGTAAATTGAQMYSQSLKGPGFAPTSTVGGGDRKPFTVPSGSMSLLGGTGGRTRLSESLAGNPQAQMQYGPQGMSPMQRFQMGERVDSMARGK